MRLIATLLAFALAALAQEKSPSFEVASIRPIGDAEMNRRPGAVATRGPGADPQIFSLNPTSMQYLLLTAFKVNGLRVVGPSWADNEMYELHAKFPEGVGRDKLDVLLLNLLIERFGLQFHRENRELPAYELVIAKGGIKMQESGPATANGLEFKETDKGPTLVTSRDKYGLLQLPFGRKGMLLFGLGGGKSRYSGRMQDMKGILTMCETRLKKPVIDKTGLTGNYDFNLDFSSGAPASPNPAGPPVDEAPESAPPFEVAIETLGLKLQSVKAPVEVIVIDKLNRAPTEN